MGSLRNAMHKANYYGIKSGQVSECARFLGINRPISVKMIIAKLDELPIPTTKMYYIALKSIANGKFVCVDGDSKLTANRDSAANCEAFEIKDQGNGNVGLLAIINGKYVCAEDAGSKPLIANRDQIGLWETFVKVDIADVTTSEKRWLYGFKAKCVFKSLANGKFVCVDDAGDSELIANRDSAANWEAFELFQHFPMQYGFKFNNSFNYDVFSAFDLRGGGLCGGMCYTVLDYYFSEMAIPALPFRPAIGTILHNHIYAKQILSIKNNIDKWTEIKRNPFGIRDTEFFNTGISLKPGERLFELKELLDTGTPCVLGLQPCVLDPLGVGSIGSEHQVIAFGYTMGQYQGDLGAHIEDFKIYVYDPNHPNVIRSLIADANRKLYYFEGDDTQTWRTYFVDKNYQVTKPPVIPNSNYPVDGLVRELVLCFSTGNDDLRGGDDNIDVIVYFIDGEQQEFRNINLGERWVVGSEENAEVVLQRGVKLEELNSLLVRTTFGGGIGGDNWDMTSLKVYAYGGGMFQQIKEVGFKRFTGSYKEIFIPLKEIPLSLGQISKLSFNFRTGDDDLRGDKDNINLTVHFNDGTTQRLENANESVCWSDNTTHILIFDLNRAVKPSEIAQIDIDTTFSGGIGGDNWNMESMIVTYILDDSEHVLATYGAKRFTGTDKSLTIPLVLTSPSQANRLVLTFHTGSDNLEGGDNNLNVSIGYRDGKIQIVPNVNGSAEWRDNTTNVVNINLNHAVPPNDITELKLETTFTGGISGDNWNMNSVQVAAIGSDVNKVIFTYGYKRFTGDNKTLTLYR